MVINKSLDTPMEDHMKTLFAAALLVFLFASATVPAFAFELTTQPQPVKVDHGNDVK